MLCIIVSLWRTYPNGVPGSQAPLFKSVCIPESFTDYALTLWTISCKYAKLVLNQRSYYWSLIVRIDHFRLSSSLQNWWHALNGKNQVKPFLVYISRIEMKLYFEKLNGAKKQGRFAINLLALCSYSLKNKTKLLFNLLYVVMGQQLWNTKIL